MTDDEKKTIGSAISALLLSDHMGDAHRAGVELSRLLWGEEGAGDYMNSVDAGRATPGMRRLLSTHVPEIWRDDQ